MKGKPDIHAFTHQLKQEKTHRQADRHRKSEQKTIKHSETRRKSKEITQNKLALYEDLGVHAKVSGLVQTLM